MKQQPIIAFLRTKGYRDTQQRRMVLEALAQAKEPSSPYDIKKWIARRHDTVSIVTVYRIVDLFVDLGIVHKHPCSGRLSLCIHPGKHGAHGYLHCHDCGTSEEFLSDEVANLTMRYARKRGFSAITPLLEIVGICKKCLPA